MVGEQTGITKARSITLPSTAFFSARAWSPDGARILLEDNHRNLWTIEAATGKSTKVDTDEYPDPGRQFDAVWSPDSRWIAYSKGLASHLRAIFICSIADGKTHQLTDGLADSISPAFDAGGKYVYFLASTDYGPRTGWLEMSSLDRPVRRAIYLGVLSSSEPSPLLPETGDEPKSAPHKETAAEVTVRIDFDKID